MSTKIEKAKWYVSDVIDDGHFGIVTEKNEIVIGSASPLSKEQAEKIVWVHNRDVNSLTHNKPVESCATCQNECKLARNAGDCMRYKPVECMPISEAVLAGWIEEYFKETGGYVGTLDKNLARFLKEKGV